MTAIKVGSQSYDILPIAPTSPSIRVNGVGYVPLFVANKGTTVDWYRYRYRYIIGGLKVGAYPAATSRCT